MKQKMDIKKFAAGLAAGVLLFAATVSLVSCRAILSDLESSDTADKTDTHIDSTDSSTVTSPPLTSDYGGVTPEDRDDGKTVICLDAGHGFGDVGCEFPDGTYEKDVTLEITGRLKKCLEDRGAVVLLTHDGITFPSSDEIMRSADQMGIKYKVDKIENNDIFSAYERSLWLNVMDVAEHVDLFVSIHVNSIENHPEISGFSIDYYENNPSVGFLVALCGDVGAMLEDEFSREVRIFADNYEDAYIVNKYTDAPSILIETGYATNKSDAANLKDKNWQQNFAENLADVLMDHLK